jgi:UDP-glucuronate 4-epimerase
MAKILITGTAGFIGFHLAEKLAAEGHDLVGIDNLNTYYNPQLKLDRLSEAGFYPSDVESGALLKSRSHPNYRFVKMELEDAERLDKLFASEQFDYVCHLAAQAGVRYSLSHPQAYVNSNVSGFVNILESSKKHKVKHLVYASSSSVYGLNSKVPFSETDPVEQPVSLYAATKRSNELKAHVYAHLYGLPCTGLRFFTVYGPWGRPDMAYSLFSDAILNDRPIKVFNHGKMSRDFTYVGDIVEGVSRVVTHPRPPQEGVPARLYNIGAGKPMELLDFIEAMETSLKQKAEKTYLDMQPGDVEQTYADTTALERDYGYRPTTGFQAGIDAFVGWYRGYYGR